MNQRTEKAAAILADHDGNDSETQPLSKERIMKTVSTLPATNVKDWNGHTIRPDDLDMQTLCNADQHTVGGSLNRAEHFITAVK